MAFRSFQHFLEELERAGELLRITEPVDTELVIAEWANREMKSPGGGKALLFEKPSIDGKTAAFPVAIKGNDGALLAYAIPSVSIVKDGGYTAEDFSGDPARDGRGRQRHAPDRAAQDPDRPIGGRARPAVPRSISADPAAESP